MPDMRQRRRRADRSRRGVAAHIVCCAAALTGMAWPATASPVPDSVATPAPTLRTGTLPPPPVSPFDEVVGGAQLGITGVPVLADGVPPPSSFDAKAWLVADAESGRVLAALNAHTTLPPASTLKLLTAIAVLPAVDADMTYTATDADVTVEGSRVGLVPGQRYSRDALVHGLLLASGNDAANALAQLAGGQSRALSLMAEEAKRLGAFDTTATTPHGLDEPGQHTSAYDLALIARAVLGNQELAAVVRTQTYDFPGFRSTTFQIQNHNRLLGRYAGAVGLKTGFTSISGHTIVAAANRDGVQLVAVVLGAEERAEQAASALFDWGFSLPPDAEPTGHLVTPAEVAAAVRARHNASSTPAAVQEATTVARGEPEPVASRSPAWVWSVGVLAAVFAAAVVTVWQRRARRPRTSAAAAIPGPGSARRD